MDQRTPVELIERIDDLERQLAEQDTKLATLKADKEVLQHQLDQRKGPNDNNAQADDNPFREELDAALKRVAAERENHDATLKSLRPASATLTPPAAKLFNAVLQHARKIHVVKRKLETTDGPNIEAWKELSGLLTRNHAVDEKGDIWKHTSTTDVNGVSYTSIKCLTTIVELEPTKEAWLALGDGLSDDKDAFAKVGGESGVSYTKKDCYLKALEIDPLYSEAWCSLGAILKEKGSNVTVNGKGSYTPLMCFKEARKHDRTNKHAWVGLGCLPHDSLPFNDHTYTPQECIVQALAIDSCYPEAWNVLGELITRGKHVDVNGKKYSKSECLSMGKLMAKVAAVEANADNADVWLSLGEALTGSEPVSVGGVSYCKQECFQKAVEIDPSNSNAWNGHAIAAFGKPPATLSELKSLDTTVADRLEKAYAPRTDNELKKALLGSNGALEQGFAVLNVLINKCNITIKGGAVRDLVCRGKEMAKDAEIDCEAPSTLKQSSWQATAKEWRDIFLGFGVACTAPVSRPSFASSGDGIIVFNLSLSYMGSTEIEVVTPWNGGYVPAKNMDFSCNNLRIEPKSNCEIRQTFTIMMTGVEIVTQLLQHPRPHASPTRDCKWVTYDSSKHTTAEEGLHGGKYVEGANPAMRARLDKFRSKGFLLVEQAHAGTNGLSIVLFHGTTLTAMNKILASKVFNPSTSGNYGPGVYLSRDMTIVTKFANPHILKAEVDPGRIYLVPAQERDYAGSWRTKGGGYDTALVTVANSFRSMEEWCIFDPKRITNIQQHK